MCGIAGTLDLRPNGTADGDLILRMTQAMLHRGPDDVGFYADGGVALGHRRLSIIDLSTGHQPLSNEDGTVWIVFNGEIYNHAELREHLVAKGHRFATRSDTEAIVHLYEEYGAECVSRLRGMFAFAIWDQRTRTLTLARDRVGIKPLYYARVGAQLLFASEVKALLAHPGTPRTVDVEALHDFMVYGYCPGERTAHAGIKRLLPGHVMTVRDGRTAMWPYWDLHAMPKVDSGESIAAASLEALLRQTVADHLISDVPVGVLLSGGVDSTAMLGFATQAAGRSLETFTVGFAGEGIVDERPYARLAARRWGATHHEATLTAAEFGDLLPTYVRHMEEPVCEPPALALHHIARVAARHVKVVLSGEGGDEAFAGYPNYRNILWLERIKRSGPLARGLSTAVLGAAARVSDHERWRRFATALGGEIPDYYWSRTAGPYSALHGAACELYTRDFRAALADAGARSFMQAVAAQSRGRSALDTMLYIDTKTWLPDDLLVKADKMTMASSIELRVPLLDHRILEFAATLPDEMKVKGARTKHILKRVLEPMIPVEILRRKKAGLPVPIERWLRGELHRRVRDVLEDPRTRERGWFEPKAVSRLLDQLQQGADVSAAVFKLLAIELWHREFVDAAAPVDDHARAVGVQRRRERVAT